MVGTDSKTRVESVQKNDTSQDDQATSSSDENSGDKDDEKTSDADDSLYFVQDRGFVNPHMLFWIVEYTLSLGFHIYLSSM